MAGERRLSATVRQAKALELRGRGLSYYDIARQLGYRGPSGAWKAVTSALDKMLREPSEQVRQIELARLDALLSGVWDKATHGDVKAIHAAIEIMGRRARLLGLDAAEKQIVLEETMELFLSSMPPEYQEAARRDFAERFGFGSGGGS